MSNPAVEAERAETALRRAALSPRTAKLAALTFAAAVTVYLGIAAYRASDETQYELRLIPYLAYDDRVDFAYFYAAADMVWHGDLDEVYPEKHEYIFYPGDPAFDLIGDEYVKARLLTRGNYYNPPLVAILQAPLTLLGFKWAFWTFSLISAGAFAAFVLLFWWLGRGIPELPLVLLGTVAFQPVHEAIIMGHLSLFFVFALGAGFFALRADRPVLAGLLLSLLALKPQWAILPGLFLLVRGEWRALASMGLAAMLLFFAPFLVAGFGTFADYVEFLRGQSSVDVGNAPHMFSWNGFLSKLEANQIAEVYTADVNEPLLYALQALTLAVVVIVWLGRDLYLGVAATIVGMLLLSTHSVWYDWAFLVVAAAALTLRPAPAGVRAQLWVLLLALFISSSQSVDTVFAPDGRHGFIHWSEAGFFSVTLVSFALLLWCAGRAVLEGRLQLPSIPWPRAARTLRPRPD
ncbi:MAG TPA: glycosyltransferase family 87 protein [Dehalococcoidia bacterium]|nr:glycosyltransferase family 87 protein [Dehalococcoidia bacterium]